MASLLRVMTVLAASLLFISEAVAVTVEPIVMKGTKFFFNNGTQFFIKGVAYQQDVQAGGQTTGSTYIDPLMNETLCARDIPLLQAIETNVIRTYAIDPTADHSGCMNLLQEAGIYVISDLSEPALSINRNDPTWDVDLYQRYASVVDELSQYENVIGFFAGNEVSNSPNTTAASAYVKAAVRDTKAYIQSKNLGRWMGVGYAANDDPTIRQDIAYYFNCGDPVDAIDFWGYNMYEWCGQNTLVGSGYAEQVQFFSTYSVPVFWAEYGCNIVPGGAEGRIWEETTAIYSDNMTGVVSGAIVYMYFEEVNDYGIVSIEPNGAASTMTNYQRLSTVIAAVDPSSTAMDAYTPTNSPAACPTVYANWTANEVLPPTPNATLCDCMLSSLSCLVSPNVATTDYGTLFGLVCGFEGNPCAGIASNATTGVYGAYSMCNSSAQLSYAMDTYYQSQEAVASACSFSGQAFVTKPDGPASTCSAALASVSSAISSASAGSSAAASSSKSFAAPMPRTGPILSLGGVVAGVYVLAAMAVGAGVLLL